MSGFPSPRGPCTAAGGEQEGEQLTLSGGLLLQGKGEVGRVLRVGILRQAWELGVFFSQQLSEHCAAAQCHRGLGSGAGYGTAVGAWIELALKFEVPAATGCSLRSNEGLRPSPEGLGSPSDCHV